MPSIVIQNTLPVKVEYIHAFYYLEYFNLIKTFTIFLS